ncbi:hypothetical protein ACI8AA_07035 [Geodermatophilus sp. SYSU D01180]
MSVLAQERPVVAEKQARPAARTPEVSFWERGSVWALLVVLFGAVVFGAMVVLTALAGGPGYPY